MTKKEVKRFIKKSLGLTINDNIFNKAITSMRDVRDVTISKINSEHHSLTFLYKSDTWDNQLIIIEDYIE